MSWAADNAGLVRFGRFLAVGVLNTIASYCVYGLLILAGAVPELALLLATIFGVGFNFFTTGRLVFGSADNSRLVRFVAVYAGIYVLNALALRYALGLGFGPLVAQAGILPFTVVLTFVAMRTFVFPEPGK